MFPNNLLGTSVLYSPDNEGAGGGNGGGGQSQTEPTGSGGKSGNGAANGVNEKQITEDVDNFLANNQDLWVDDAEEGNDAPSAEEMNRQEVVKKQNKEVLDQHVSRMKFVPDEISEETVTKIFENKDIKELTKLINGAGQAAYKQALLDAGNIVENKAKELRGEIDAGAQRRLNISEAERSLKETLPKIMNNPAMAPVAKAVKSRLLKREGMTDDKANKLTKKYFLDMTGVAGDDLDLDIESGSKTNGRGNVGGDSSRPARRKAESQVNWAEVLKPTPAPRH